MHVAHMKCMFDEAHALDGRSTRPSCTACTRPAAAASPRPWRIARRPRPVAKARCILWYWMELAARPDREGRPPRAYTEAYLLDFSIWLHT